MNLQPFARNIWWQKQQVYSTLDSKFKSLNTFSFAEHKLNPTLTRNLSADIYIPEDVKKQEEKLIAPR